MRAVRTVLAGVVALVTSMSIPLAFGGQIAYDVTSIATPGNLYQLGPKPPELLREAGD